MKSDVTVSLGLSGGQNKTSLTCISSLCFYYDLTPEPSSPYLLVNRPSSQYATVKTDNLDKSSSLLQGVCLNWNLHYIALLGIRTKSFATSFCSL